MPKNESLRVQPAPGVQEGWLPMESAPKDGTLVRLLVEFSHHATEDGEGPHPTIGSNTADNTGEDMGWQFAGWCWTQDRYTQGEGTPVGWLPMLSATPQPLATSPIDDHKLRDIALQTAWSYAFEAEAPKYLPRSSVEAAVWKTHRWVIASMKKAIEADRATRFVDLVNAAGILASDRPGEVVKKLDAAYVRATLKGGA